MLLPRPVVRGVAMDPPLPPGHDLKQLYSNVPPPPPEQPLASVLARSKRRRPVMGDVDSWCRHMALFIDTGRLHCLDKIVAVIGHVEPRAAPLLHPRALESLLPAGGAPLASGTDSNPAFEGLAKLDQSRYLAPDGGFGPLSLQLVKNDDPRGGIAKAKVMVENLFNWRCVSEVFGVIDAQRLSYANLYDAFEHGDISLLLRQTEQAQQLTARAGGVITSFLLLLLYVKLCLSSRGSDDVSVLFNNLKRNPPRMDIPNVPTEVFLSALAERRVRFFESPSFDQYGAIKAPRLQRSTLYWNELFETAELEYLRNTYKAAELGKTIRDMATGQAELDAGQPQTVEELVDSASRHPERLAQYTECIYRARQYRYYSPSILLTNLRFLSGQRKAIHPSQFTPEFVDFLLSCLEDYSHPKYIYPPMIISCLQLLVAWLRLCNDDVGRSYLIVDPQRPIVDQTLRGVAMLENIFNRTSPDGALYALCFTYLGASIGVLKEKSDASLSTIVRELEQKPDALVRSQYLTTILSGVGDAMISLPPDRLAHITGLLLQMWNSCAGPARDTSSERRSVKGKEKDGTEAPPLARPGSPGLPPLRQGLAVLNLMRHVFVNRAVGRNAFSAATPSRQPASLANETGDWLHAIVGECVSAYEKTENVDPLASHFVALFAAGGLLGGISMFRRTYEVSPHEEELLGGAQSKLLSLTSHSLKLSTNESHPEMAHDYRRTVTAAICTRIDSRLLLEEDRMAMLRLVLDLLLGEVFSYAWIIEAMQQRDPALLPKILEFRRMPLYTEARNFIQALCDLLPNIQPCDRQYAFDRIHAFSEDLYQSWRQAKGPLGGRAKDPTEKEIRSFMQMIFLCVQTLFAITYKVMSAEQCVRALQTVSYLQFARISMALYDIAIHKIVQIAAEDKASIKELVGLFPDSLKGGDVDHLDPYELERVVFFMTSILPALPLVDEDQLNERLLPLMFRNVAHADMRVSKNVHQMFKALFIDPFGLGARAMQPHVTKLVPYYLKVCLDRYGHQLPWKSFADCFVALTAALPPTSSLLVLSFKLLADKIQEIQQRTAENGTKQLPSGPASPNDPDDPRLLIFLLFSFVIAADVQVLDIVLVLIRNVIKSSPEATRPQLCKYVHDMILSNYDYTRKDQCVKWYLQLVQDLKLAGVKQASRLLPPSSANNKQEEQPRESAARL